MNTLHNIKLGKYNKIIYFNPNLYSVFAFEIDGIN